MLASSQILQARTEMAELTLSEAAERLAISPLQVLVGCALRGIPCPAGMLDEDVLPALGAVRPTADDEAQPTMVDGPAGEGTGRERRLRIVRRILEKLSTMGKFWPARTQKRSTARGLEGSEIGLALRAVDVLLECGILLEETHGGHEPRVGLDGARRLEIAQLIADGVTSDSRLEEWIEKG